MTLPNHYRCLEHMLASAPISQLTGVDMTVSKGRAEIFIPVQERFFHAAGALHGAIYFMALDNAAFFAANSVVRDVFVLTTSFNLHLLRPISHGQLRAVGTLVAQTRSQLIADAVAYNHRGREIARGSGVFVPSKIPLSADIGYA